MNESVTTTRLPWAGIVVSTLSLIVMAGISWTLWDSLPDPVITRQATPERAGAAVPKLVAAAALPGALLAIAAVMAVATKIGNHLRQHVDPRLVASPASLTRSMNTLFTLLPLFLVVLHAGFLLVTAGHDFPIEHAVAVGFGVLLMGLGNLLPKITMTRASRNNTWGRLLLAWQSSQRVGGAAMMLLGAACIVAAFIIPPRVAAVTAAMLIAMIYVMMVVRTASRL